MSSRQPFLHDLAICLSAPTQLLSSRSGDIVSSPDREGAQGVWHGDLRVLSDLRLEVNGEAPEPIAARVGSRGATFTALARNVGAGRSDSHDPQVRVDRVRRLSANQVRESITVTSVLPEPAELTVTIELGSDGAAMDRVRLGDPARPRPLPSAADSMLGWPVGELSASLSAPGATFDGSEDRTRCFVRWNARLPARASMTFEWLLEITDQDATVLPAPETGALEVERLVDSVVADLAAAGAHDHRVRPWLVRSLADLNGLRMATAETPDLAFFAAGAPWYLTLFGRDSLWAARLLLDLDPDHAVSTLQTLARYQGARVDPDSAEAPGKIIHELRRATIEAAGAASLPPRYYGTIDATPLWICLLHDAWQQGMAAERVAALLPNLQAGLEWLARFGDADGDGFLEYLDESGHGLANQGWKDSADSVRFADGGTAVGPVALCEVQGYAYEAAVKGAALLDAFELPGADSWRTWAAELADRFRAQFWCGPPGRRYPALALDRDKKPVDALTSNIGHLLGTGILSPAEERAVAELLTSPAMDCGLGLRTMSSDSGAYSPLSYHCGSVWPHDTAIVLRGMVAAGLTEYAGGLVEGLLQASVSFEQRLPELWSGEGVAAVPYPAACRPQAWSAAAAVTVALAMLATART